jgi:hypothetical protein
MYQNEALDFVMHVFREEIFVQHLARYIRSGDWQSVIQLARSLGFIDCTIYDITLALEIRIKRLLKTNRITESQLRRIFGTDNWIDSLHNWQSAFSAAV